MTPPDANIHFQKQKVQKIIAQKSSESYKIPGKWWKNFETQTKMENIVKSENYVKFLKLL